jgi:hypothetical protein
VSAASPSTARSCSVASDRPDASCDGGCGVLGVLWLSSKSVCSEAEAAAAAASPEVGGVHSSTKSTISTSGGVSLPSWLLSDAAVSARDTGSVGLGQRHEGWRASMLAAHLHRRKPMVLTWLHAFEEVGLGGCLVDEIAEVLDDAGVLLQPRATCTCQIELAYGAMM